MSTLEDFAQLIKRAKEEKLLQEEEMRSATLNAAVPMLESLWETIAASKGIILPEKIVEDISIEAKPEPILTEVVEVTPEQNLSSEISLVENSLHVLNTLGVDAKRKKLLEEQEYGDASETEKKLFKLIKKLQGDITSLKSNIDSKSIGYSTAGSGEVRILRMDDVVRQTPQDGGILVWDSSLNKFKMVLPNPVGLDGGAENQVLVKVSGSDYDFEWQDMKVTVPVYTKLVDVVSPTVTYIGESAPGVTSCDPLWRIKRVVYSGPDIEITWANNTDIFDKVWDSRATYTFNSVCIP